MAHHKSAKKRIRRNARRTDINRVRMNRIRTYIKKVEAAIRASDKEAAQNAFRETMPEIHRGVTKGVLHRNTANRRLSGLNARIKAL